MPALPEILKHLRSGGMIILTDDEDRENEGDLVMAAEFATPEAIRFMAQNGCGLICMPMPTSQIDRLGLSPMVANNKARRSTAFTVSIEARDGITTGISAFDRSHTIKVAANPEVAAGEIVSPGHIFPLHAKDGGVLARAGHTEGAVDLMRLAGLNPCAVICEVMGKDGHMAHGEELLQFAKTHKLPMYTIRDLVRHRLETEAWLKEVAVADLPTRFADAPLKLHAFRSDIDGVEHLALVKRPFGETPLVRVHSECLTGEALGSLRCDCGAQLEQSIRRVAQEGGMVIYLRGHEGRGIGLANKVAAYALQDKGQDTLQANLSLGFGGDDRDYAAAAKMLKHFGVARLRLLTNNPAKVAALETHGLNVAQRVPLEVGANAANASYLDTKRSRFGHLLSLNGNIEMKKIPTDNKKLRLALVVSRFNTEVTGGLKRGALAYLKEQGITIAETDRFDAPGAFEIPLLAQTLARSKKFHGVICLGCVIKGDTAHFEFISLGATMGLMQASLATETPITFGILTTYTDEQAEVRSRDDAHNKGREAAAACVEALAALRKIGAASR